MTGRASLLGGLGMAAALLTACTGGGDGDGNSQSPAYYADCYKTVSLDAEPPPPSRAVFVLIDRTTGLNDGLRDRVSTNLVGLLGAGTVFKIATFAAKDKQNYAQIHSGGEIQETVQDPQLRENLPVNRLEMLDACLKQQAAGVKAEAASKLGDATSVSASDFKQSEILASLTHLSEAVRASPAEEKLVILVSDLLEHSSVSSFYESKQLRMIDPAAELDKAEKARMIGDFGGARVAIVGAGLLAPETGADKTRNETALLAMRNFWEQWLERSNAELAEYGRPDLVNPLRWTAARSATAPAS